MLAPVLGLALSVALAIALAGPSPAAGTLPAPPVSIFYYPWYGSPALDGGWRHGADASSGIASEFYPARGTYSSGNGPLVGAQMREIAAAGVGEVVTSWWGWGSVEDRRLPLVLAEARAAGLAVAVHLEPYPGRTIQTVEADIRHLRTLGITRFYVYAPSSIPAGEWAALRGRVGDVQLLAETTLAGWAAAARFDGIYTYDVLLYGPRLFGRLCTQAHAVGLLCLPSVGPGYDAERATGDVRVKPRRNGATYDAMWRGAIRSSADGVTITSYNEWHEGTQIEPARTFGRGTVGTVAFEDYDGAWGRHGRAAERAYLDRTAYWSGVFVRSCG